MITPAISKAQTQRCGVERWDIKTLSDPGAKKVDTRPEVATIESLIGQKKPTSKRLPSYRLPQEFKTYKIRVQLIGYKRETDGDFHVVVANPNNPQQTMVVEIPDPVCNGAKDSGFAEKYQAARSAITHLVGTSTFGRGIVKPNGLINIEVIGVAFFDVPRGQTGMAPNGIELHPVLSIARSQ